MGVNDFDITRRADGTYSNASAEVEPSAHTFRIKLNLTVMGRHELLVLSSIINRMLTALDLADDYSTLADAFEDTGNIYD